MAEPELTPLGHTHQSPPDSIRSLHKHYQKALAESLASDSRVLEFTNLSEFHRRRLNVVGKIEGTRLQKIFKRFEASAAVEGQNIETSSFEEIEEIGANDRLIYEHELLPGLQFIPSLFPYSSQRVLLSRLWMRDLSNPLHQTNLNLHYHIPYPNCETSSFFGYDDPEKVLLRPKDPKTHKPLTVVQMMRKKLRWMTLGGQYDWTRKVYPEMDTKEARNLLVPFPHDIATLIHSIFPNLHPQAAISNLYTPGDTLSPHRDISEASSAPLASISIGTDAIFIIGLPEGSPAVGVEEERLLVVRVKSGDVLLMGGESRWAWHSVPKILSTDVGTKADTIENWPGSDDGASAENPLWAGWMKNRRVNLNVRQMWD